MVAEALEPGVVGSDVARLYDVTVSGLFGWMRQFRGKAMARMSPPKMPMFAPAVVDVARYCPVSFALSISAERAASGRGSGGGAACLMVLQQVHAQIPLSRPFRAGDVKQSGGS